MSKTETKTEAQERVIAQLVTSSVAGMRWRELTPLDIARHLVSNGVRYVIDVKAHDEGLSR